jgi:hypothetical protein
VHERDRDRRHLGGPERLAEPLAYVLERDGVGNAAFAAEYAYSPDNPNDAPDDVFSTRP